MTELSVSNYYHSSDVCYKSTRYSGKVELFWFKLLVNTKSLNI